MTASHCSRPGSLRLIRSGSANRGATRGLTVAAVTTCSIALFSVNLIVYARSVRFAFVNFDDTLYVTANDHVKAGLTLDGIRWALTSIEGYWQPLAWLSHMLDCELFGLNAGAHHIMSALFHALTAALLFAFLARVTRHRYHSLCIAAIWALHPLRVESVAWAAERKDVLSGLFGVATLMVWCWYVAAPSRKRYTVVLLTFALALMSKPTLVALPVVLLLFDWWPLQRNERWRGLVWEKLPLFAMSAAVGLITIAGQNRSGALALVTAAPGFRIENAIVNTVIYIGKMLWPANLAAFYPYPKKLPIVVVLLSVAFLLAVTGTVLLQRRNRPYLLVGWFWYLTMLLPTIGVIQAGRQSMGDRFTYWPMIGIVLAAVWFMAERLESHPALHQPVVWVTAVLLFMLVLGSWRQTGYWRNSVTLFEHALQAGGDNDYIRGNLATTLIAEGAYAEAAGHLLRAIKLAPDHFEHHDNLAVVWLAMGRVEDAEWEAREVLRLAPHTLQAAKLAATVQLRQGHLPEALDYFEQAVRLGADTTTIAVLLNDHGASIASNGRPSDAEPLVRKAIELNPALIQARRNLVLVLVDQGRMEDARASLRLAIDTSGSRPEFRDLVQELMQPQYQ